MINIVTDLRNLPERKNPIKHLDLPIDVSYVERRCMRICPLFEGSVSVFSCLHCEMFEIYEERVRKVTSRSGKCMFPRRASKASRKITQNWGLNLYSKYTKGTKKSSSNRKRKKLGGMADKVNSAVSLMKSGMLRDCLLKKLSQKYPDASSAYLNTVYYKAKKIIKYEDAKKDTL